MLTTDRNTQQAIGDLRRYPMAANAEIFGGALVCINAAGFAVRGDAVSTLVAVGRAEERASNAGGANGAAFVTVRRGTFRFDNSASASAITLADVGAQAFVVDDETVARDGDDGARPVAGFVDDVDEHGVWVRIDPALGRPNNHLLVAIADLTAAIDAIGD